MSLQQEFFFSSDNHINSNYILPKSKQRKNYQYDSSKVLGNSKNTVRTPHKEYNYNYNYNNININVNNLIINNGTIGRNYYSPIDFKANNNRIFSKIGNDVIGKGKKNVIKKQNKIGLNENERPWGVYGTRLFVK